jgi:hypothetical protein
MKVRDRLIVAAVAAIAVLGAFWLVLVSPERDTASSLSSQIAGEQTALSDARTSLAAARSAAAGYPGDVRALANVVTAVPTSIDEPTVISTITKLAGAKVDVHEIDVSDGDSAAAATPLTGAANALNLSFTFNSTYAGMQKFLAALDNLIQTDGTNIAVGGRMFTVSAISFKPSTTAGVAVAVTAQAYSQNVTAAGATGATGPTTTTTAAVTP